MDDSCAVCAESLEWVAYGACGHKDVCSTCVARLRFICHNRRCCICTSECAVVFVTKALGDYTTTISDFCQFPSEPKEGRVGPYWYHEDTQAFFDDFDHYQMIRAMCRLSCCECDKIQEQTDDRSRRRPKFKDIEHLKSHLHHQHTLYMCNLCLEGRKVFICEQNLYTRPQLTQHVNTGNSEVDGTESERGGFMGHPFCEFCRTPFYGDNELFTHMSTEHYTCHFCQRQHPGQHDYYKNYDDLEIHFRQDHFLCENEDCLGKKFIVFPSEAELKKHNTLEHGGRMSRSQRNAALQIPTSFRYRSSEQNNRFGRGRSFRRDPRDNELSLAIEASLETSTATPSSSRTVAVFEKISDVETYPPLESIATSDPELSSRYRQAVSLPPTLAESSFPPLPMTSRTGQQSSSPGGVPKKNMAAQLRHQSNCKANTTSSGPSWPAASQPSSSGPAWPAASRIPSHQAVMRAPYQPRVIRAHSQPTIIRAPSQPTASLTSSSGPAWPAASKTLSKPAASQTPSPPAASQTSSLGPTWPATSRTPSQPVASQTLSQPAASSTSSHAWPSISGVSGSSSSGQSKPRSEASPSNYSLSVQSHSPLISGSSVASSLISSKTSGASRLNHSSSAPNLSERGSVASPDTDFPPVSATQTPHKSQATEVKVEDVRTVNKDLVERMHGALGFDKDKFNAFKEISGEYRIDLIDAMTYLAYAEQFGLSGLIPELARLIPEAHKRKELIEVYNVYPSQNTPRDNGVSNGMFVKYGNGFKKGKGKSVDPGPKMAKNNLADDVISKVKELQSSYRASEEEVEVLSKDGYRADNGKSKLVINETQVGSSGSGAPTKLETKTNQNLGNGNVKGKQKKKTSKFHRVRLGDGSIEALLDFRNNDPDPDPDSNSGEGSSNPSESLPARGVWRNGGGQKLLAKKK